MPIGPLRVYPEQGTEWMGAVLLTSWHEDSSFGELWLGRMTAPEDALVPGTCDYVLLHGKMNFAEGIKVIDIKIGRLSWVGPT